MAEELDPFVGRTKELSVLRRAMADVDSGRPQTVLLSGPAGIGKTSLSEQFLAELNGPRVLRASGEQWEALVAFGVIDQLVRAAGLSGGILLAGRQRMLPPEEPLGVGAVLLGALEDLERQSPVILFVDDAHWADIDSLRTLLFVLRRLGSCRVMTLLAVREEDALRVPEGLRRLATGRTGLSIHPKALASRDVLDLAKALGAPEFRMRTAQRLCEHTRGNPLFVRAMLTELPVDRWNTWEPVLPAPRAFVAQVVSRLSACSAATQSLIEACSILGIRSLLRTAAKVANIADPVPALEEATLAGLLKPTDEIAFWDVTFPHPLVQAAVYEHVPPRRRILLHSAAAALVDDPGGGLRHRVAATTPPDTQLAEDLDAFARLEMRWGAWASAASALVEASKMSNTRDDREQRMLRAIDAIVSAGDLVQASSFTRDVARFEPGPLRDAALGYLAILRGQVVEAEALLRTGWARAELAADPPLSAQLSLRLALHGVGRLSGIEIVQWCRRAMALVPGDDAVRLEAEALLGLGLGLMGQVPEGIAANDAALGPLKGDGSSTAGRIEMANSWLKIVVDDLDGVSQTLAEVARVQLINGSIRIAVWSYVWLSRVNFLSGEWDYAADAAARAVALLEETGHEWLRPLARWAAVQVAASKGDWSTAEAHADQATARSGDYELMIVASALVKADLAWLRGDHDEVLRVLEPVREIQDRPGVDEPGFWPWQHLYGDALVSAGRLEDAANFLAPHEQLAQLRQRRSSIARLARVRGRLEAAAGRFELAETTFRRGLEQLEEIVLPFEQALLELAYGKVLRRHGHRRSATAQLEAARERFKALGALPLVETCEMELTGNGLAPTRRTNVDPTRLTPQELAVAQLAVTGMSNRDIALKMSIGTKTVQFHIGNIYTKLGVRTRLQLANRLAEIGWG